jgi:glycosyltransferase involved in cell wall biosynthesis
MSLRIGLVGPLPPPSGGIPNQTRQLAMLLREAGAHVVLVQVNAPYRPAWIGRIKGLRAVARLLPYLWVLWRTAGQVDLLHVMANSGWSWHLFATPAVWIAYLRRCPVVVNYRGGELASFLARADSIAGPSLRRASRIIVPSGFLQAVFADYNIAAEIVPNIVNLERFAPCPHKACAADTATTVAPRLLVARNLEPIYDNATALLAFGLIVAIYPQATLVIAGSGPLHDELATLAAELGLSGAVHFTGALDNHAMPALYRDADLMLNPSTVDNTPNSVLEALASGVPVVSTNVGGIPFLVDHERTALLVPPRSPRHMADAALRILGDPALARRLREAGRLHAQQFSWEAVKPRLFETYNSVLNKS